MHRITPVVTAVAVALALTAAAPATAPTAAPPPAVPTRASALQAARLALDHFYENDGGATASAGWRWTPFFMAAEELYRETGDPRYGEWVTAWGERNAWTADAPESATSNPDSRAAIQVFQDAAAAGLPVDLAPSDRLMAADLALPSNRYWWIDAMFMGLPLWPRWQARTGDPAYGAKHAEFYDFLKNHGATRYRASCTDTGLFDPTEDLWWRDCKFVPARDELGHKVFWARGNGWVLAAMARTLMALPPDDPQAAEYRTMLQRMAARLVPLQGDDGMWRSNLLSPSLHPAPETSATALFTYAMAYGVRTGLLDAATYEPVVLAAWQGLTSVSLTGSGFLSNCQLVGDSPADPSTSASIGYCVGAFALAALEVARLRGPVATDLFARTTTGGLGSADAGGPWTLTGPAGDFSVDGASGWIRTPAGRTRTATLPSVVSDDTDVRATVDVTRPTRQSLYVALCARQVGPASYCARLVVRSSGAPQLQTQRSGTTMRTATLDGLTVTTSDRLVLRVEATGTSPTTVRAKVWPAGTPEPASWQVTSRDSTAALQTSGAVGVATYLSAGAAPAALVVGVDDLVVRRSG